MSLKNYSLFIFCFLLFFFYKENEVAKSEEIESLTNYLNQIQNFSVSFIQDDKEIISEGKISIGKERLRIEYKVPTKILIILSKDKAMYYNYELDEDEFFDPKNTSAWFFYDIFNNNYFFLDAKIINLSNSIVLEKEGETELGTYNLKLFFEDKPLILRKIELITIDFHITLSLFNHNFNDCFKNI